LDRACGTVSLCRILQPKKTQDGRWQQFSTAPRASWHGRAVSAGRSVGPVLRLRSGPDRGPIFPFSRTEDRTEEDLSGPIWSDPSRSSVRSDPGPKNAHPYSRNPFFISSFPLKKTHSKSCCKTIKTAPKNHASTAKNLDLKVSEF